MKRASPSSAPSPAARVDPADPSGRPRGRETLGMFLGVVGVATFALTLPMTRIATGTADAPLLSPWFVTSGRVTLAGFVSLLFLLLTRSPLPTRAQVRPIALAALGNAIGFPLLLALGLRSVSASHAAVVTALLPLATAACAALVLRQRAGRVFWICAATGSALVLAFSLWRAGGAPGSGSASLVGDGLLVLAVCAASVGYVYGAQVTPALGAERVICWVCVMVLPVSVPATAWLWPSEPAPSSAWLAFMYLGLFSMWIGFFAWYRGLAMGGALRVSQAQLLQPFFSILAAVPLLGEPLDAATVGFAFAVVATVLAGRRLSRPAVRPAAPPVPSPHTTPANESRTA